MRRRWLGRIAKLARLDPPQRECEMYGTIQYKIKRTYLPQPVVDESFTPLTPRPKEGRARLRRMTGPGAVELSPLRARASHNLDNASATAAAAAGTVADTATATLYRLRGHRRVL